MKNKKLNTSHEWEREITIKETVANNQITHQIYEQRSLIWSQTRDLQSQQNRLMDTFVDKFLNCLLTGNTQASNKTSSNCSKVSPNTCCLINSISKVGAKSIKLKQKLLYFILKQLFLKGKPA